MGMSGFLGQYKLEHLPTIRKSYFYLLLIPIVPILILVLSKSHFSDFEKNLILYSFLIGFGLTFGSDDLRPYYRKVDSWLKTFIIAITVYIFQIVIYLFLTPFVGNDPQGFAEQTLTLYQFFKLLSWLPFVSLGEEFFKILVFLGLLSLLRLQWFWRLTLSTVIISFTFGYIHIISYQLNVGLPLALSAIPYFLIFVRYSSIYPLVIAHFFHNLISYIKLFEFGDKIIYLIIAFTSLIILVSIFHVLKSWAKNVQ